MTSGSSSLDVEELTLIGEVVAEIFGSVFVAVIVVVGFVSAFVRKIVVVVVAVVVVVVVIGQAGILSLERSVDGGIRNLGDLSLVFFFLHY